MYDLEGNFVKKFNSFNECDDYLKLYRGTTSKVFRGLTKVLRKKYIPKLIWKYRANLLNYERLISSVEHSSWINIILPRVSTPYH